MTALLGEALAIPALLVVCLLLAPVCERVLDRFARRAGGRPVRWDD